MYPGNQGSHDKLNQIPLRLVESNVIATNFSRKTRVPMSDEEGQVNEYY